MTTPHTAVSPASPDKALVATGATSDSTGWIVAMIKEQRDTLVAMIVNQKELLEAVISGNDVRYDQRFEASKEAITAALSAAKEAVVKAESAAEKRFEAVNEFRATLADQQRTLMPRSESEALFKNMADKVDGISLRLTESAGNRAGTHQGWVYALGAIGLIATLLSIVSVLMVLFRR